MFIYVFPGRALRECLVPLLFFFVLCDFLQVLMMLSLSPLSPNEVTPARELFV